MKKAVNIADELGKLKSKISNTKTAQTVFRLGAFVVLAAVIVLLFPRYNNSFRYHFEVGKPWGYATLTADFDFPIYKTDDQLNTEKKQLLSTFTPCYKYIPRVQRQVLVVSLGDMEWIQAEGFSRIAVMQNRVSKTYSLSEVYTPKTAYAKFGYVKFLPSVIVTFLPEIEPEPAALKITVTTLFVP